MARSPRGLRFRDTARLAVACLAMTGCTMCPDPLDYAGPVPNGSAPQNDFRARSNGILPLGGVAQPWPQIVSSEGRAPESVGVPTLAADVDEPVAPDTLPAEVVSVLVGDDGPGTSVIAADDSSPPAGDEDASRGSSTTGPTDDGDIVAMLLPPHEQPAPVTPPVRESPGWKRRR